MEFFQSSMTPEMQFFPVCGAPILVMRPVYPIISRAQAHSDTKAKIISGREISLMTIGVFLFHQVCCPLWQSCFFILSLTGMEACLVDICYISKCNLVYLCFVLMSLSL
ncbi:hypothetical protein AMTRI_Chr11g97920 [Amborella trichopoda]